MRNQLKTVEINKDVCKQSEDAAGDDAAAKSPEKEKNFYKYASSFMILYSSSFSISRKHTLTNFHCRNTMCFLFVVMARFPSFTRSNSK